MHRIVIAIVLVTCIGGTSAHAAPGGRRRSVRHPGPGLAAPLAAADSYSLVEGETLTIAAPGVLANDILNTATIASFGPSTGVEEATLGSTLLTARGGSLRLSAQGGFTYTPSPGFTGADTFVYVLRNAGGSSSATVTIDVRAVTATAVSDSYATAPETPLAVPAPGVLTNDTLAGGRIASFGANSGNEQSALGTPTPTARGGVVTLSQDGSFAYTPPPTVEDSYGYTRIFLGLDNFVYAIQRGSVFSTAMVNVSVDVAPSGADYVVTTPGHYYSLSGTSGENPPLQLTRGKTYTFEISVSPSHPFAILDAPPGSVTNNNITRGTLTFAVPLAAQSYTYRCTTHGFGNVITTVP